MNVYNINYCMRNGFASAPWIEDPLSHLRTFLIHLSTDLRTYSMHLKELLEALTDQLRCHGDLLKPLKDMLQVLKAHPVHLSSRIERLSTP